MTAVRRIMVTGASSGIGRATALALARGGAALVLVSRSAQALSRVEAECRSLGGAASYVVADVSDAAAVSAAFEQARAEGPLDAVVHSAGALSYGRFEQVPAEVFDHAIATTLGGTANVARSALTMFRADGERGELVVVGSLLGKIATPYMSSYVTAKWGVHGLVRTLQIEARATPDIHISLVSPGGVDTPVYRQAGTYLTRHGRPPPPVDPPEKVADAVVSALARPRRERSVGIANGLVVTGFRLLPAVFDAVVTPLMRLGGLSGSNVEPTPGNVLDPSPDGEAVHDGWQRWGGSRHPSRKGLIVTGVPSVEQHTRATAEHVWSVLAEGWLYPSWVVGASRVRRVEPDWPEVGQRIHHSFGVWPLVLDDVTEVVESQPPRLLRLRAKGWPAGEALVTLTLEREPTGTHLRMAEDASSGPGLLVPRPIRQAVITPRNSESLRRLVFLAEGRSHSAL